MLDEYAGSGEDRIKNRNGLTELIGDMMFVIPAIKIANIHRGRLHGYTVYGNIHMHIYIRQIV